MSWEACYFYRDWATELKTVSPIEKKMDGEKKISHSSMTNDDSDSLYLFFRLVPFNFYVSQMCILIYLSRSPLEMIVKWGDRQLNIQAEREGNRIAYLIWWKRVCPSCAEVIELFSHPFDFAIWWMMVDIAKCLPMVVKVFFCWLTNKYM